MTKQQTRNIDIKATAWFQLLSAAGTFLDRFHGGQVNEHNREDLWVLKECVNRVIQLEGMRERPDTGEYEVVVLPEDGEDAKR